MDPGRVVWLPDGSFGNDYQLGCDIVFGWGQTFVCDVEPDPSGNGVDVWCCPY